MSEVHDPTNVPNQATEVDVEGFNLDAFDEDAPTDPADQKYEVSGRSLSTLFDMANAFASYVRGELSIEEACLLLDAGGNDEGAFEDALDEVYPILYKYLEATQGTCGKARFNGDALKAELDAVKARRVQDEALDDLTDTFEELGFQVIVIDIEG